VFRPFLLVLLVGVFSDGKSTTIYSVFFHLTHSFAYTPSSPPITHHLIAASHSFTVSPTPGAETLARALLVSHDTSRSLPPPPTANFTHPQPATKHNNHRFTRHKIRPQQHSRPQQLFLRILYKVGQKSSWVQEEHGSHKDERLASSTGKSGTGLCLLCFDHASIIVSDGAPGKNPLLHP